MNNYIFITKQGITYQPNTLSSEPDIENCQVIGFAKGNNENEAMKNLIKENEDLLKTNFNELICMELKNEDHYSKAKYFFLGDYE